MKLRAFLPSDIEQVRNIHEKYYKEKFALPDFINKYICAFVIEENGRIISASGIRTIAESIAVTDKDISTRKRKDALEEILRASKYVTNHAGYNQLHAFVDDDMWLKILKKYGFDNCKGNAVFVEV